MANLGSSSQVSAVPQRVLEEGSEPQSTLSGPAQLQIYERIYWLYSGMCTQWIDFWLCGPVLVLQPMAQQSFSCVVSSLDFCHRRAIISAALWEETVRVRVIVIATKEDEKRFTTSWRVASLVLLMRPPIKQVLPQAREKSCQCADLQLSHQVVRSS